MDTAFFLILVPSCFAIVMKEKRIYLTLTSLFISIMSMAISAIVIGAKGAVPIIVVCVLLSGMLFIDAFRLHLWVRKLYKSLMISMQETQALLDQQKLNQMKDVIGNVSHDLKTVSVLMNRL